MKSLMFVFASFLFVTLAQSQSFPYGRLMTDTCAITRPANATAYAAGDVVRDTATNTLKFFKWTVARQTGGQGFITAASMVTDTCNVAGAQFTLLLFKDTTGMGAGLAADNAAYQMTYGNGTKFVGQVSFSLKTYGTAAAGGAESRDYQSGLGIPFITLGTQIYGVLVCDGAYTPALSGKIRIRLWSDLN